jgi:REP element-mobilizing transposase RayT
MDTLEIKRKNLPHWRSSGVIYFVTWRLYRQQELLRSEERELVCRSLLHFDGERYLLGAYVVMDDHVHVIVVPLPENKLDEILHSWRSFTANQLQQNNTRTGKIWQEEPYDRIMRNLNEAKQKANYILDNPFRRWPELREYAFMGSGSLDWN